MRWGRSSGTWPAPARSFASPTFRRLVRRRRNLRKVVVCITHLPQIAAPADLHLAVGKVTVGGRTKTEVKRVEGETRVEEIARMLGGRKAPDTARLHAEEILKRAVAK